MQKHHFLTKNTNFLHLYRPTIWPYRYRNAYCFLYLLFMFETFETLETVEKVSGSIEDKKILK